MVWIAGIAAVALLVLWLTPAETSDDVFAVALAGALAACPLAFAGYGLLDHLRSSNDEQA